MGIVEQRLLQLKSEKRRWRRAAAILTVLSLLVATVVSWSLRMTGITIANGATCGQEEHQHTEECLPESVLICGYDAEAESCGESTPASTSETDGQESAPPAEQTRHAHTEACYQLTYQCGLEAHIHELSCYSDATADLESAAIWTAGLPELTEDWAENLVRVALSQLGCGESTRNYILADDAQTRHGITRYGQWYGNPYGDWSSMFVLFCLHYAQIPPQALPQSPGVDNMMRLLQDQQLFLQPDENLGCRGNLLFLDTDQNGNADRIMVVCGSESGAVTVICGDWENTVAQITLSATDPDILGYLHIRQLQEAWLAQAEPVPSTPTEPESAATPEETTSDTEADTPAISLAVEFPEEGRMHIVAQIRNVNEAMYLWQWQYSEDGNEPWIDIEGATALICELEDTEENFNRYYRLQGRKAARLFLARAAETDNASSEGVNEDSTIISDPITPFSIGKTGSTYTVDVFALPVDATGQRITALAPTELEAFSVTYSNWNNKTVTVEDCFDTALGTYRSAYFGTAASVSVDNIESVWCGRYYSRGYQYTLAYRQTNGTENSRWLTNTNTNVSLYLRYTPTFTVTFESEGFAPLTESVPYGGFPTQSAPGTWSRDGYTLLGWTVNHSEQNVYTFRELTALPITENVTYTAKWVQEVAVSFNLGAYAQDLHPIERCVIPYGSTISPLPTPTWKNNAVAMSFDGWYLNEELSQQVTAEHKFFEDTILHAKWSPRDEGYYVYFMDFEREDQTPLVLVTYSVTEGQTVSPYTPGNAPAGTEWDGKWYLDTEGTNAYSFLTPVSDMADYLTGVNGRDLYLYPGKQDVCRAIFVTYGTKVDPVTVPVGGSIDLDRYKPERTGFVFAGWARKDGTAVSGVQQLTETTTFYAQWNAGYVPFEAILRIENANDGGMTQAEILGTWYAKAGSQILVRSTYAGTGSSRQGTHEVVCVADGEEYPVYRDAALTQKATLEDVYSSYFIYNNTGTTWTDAVNWDDVYTGGEVPYSTRPVSSAGDTIINFDYMRVRTDVNFVLPNKNGYLDIFKLYQEGLLTGSVTYTGTKPTAAGSNVSASGISGTNMKWLYTAVTGNNSSNTYTLLDVKYGQRIYDDYPVGGSWLSVKSSKFYTWDCNGTNFTSRREDLSDAFFKGSGRNASAYDLNAEFTDYSQTALMYAIECLPGQTADFTISNVGYKVQTHLCEVVNSSGNFSAKELLGCYEGKNAKGSGYYSNLNSSTATVGGSSVQTLFGTTYWEFYNRYTGIDSLSDIDRAYIFYYDRMSISISFSFGYDADSDFENEVVVYEDVPFGETIDEYRFGQPGFAQHALLSRDGYEFAGWLDANGFVLEAEDWASMVATGDSENNTMIFIAKWEKISNNIVEYYEDRSSTEAFETHYFDDGELLPYPTMTVYPQGWVWQEYGEGQFQRFDWDVPMYGEYGVQEIRDVNGEEQVVNVVRIYGTWDESHTKVVYDPNAPQGGIPGTAPTDSNEYTIWQSEVPVASRGETANADPNMAFAGWQLDRNGIVYQPGDHVPVQWPRTMILTAQWAKAEDIVYLRYDPNGGAPGAVYPNDSGFPYKKNATAAVWDNTGADGAVWFSRTGYAFIGWNTQPDGSGTSYAPNASIMLTAPVTTLYAQWQRTSYTLSVYKVDSDSKAALAGATFSLYRQENGVFLSTQSLTTGVDGHITFLNLETDTLYKLVEEKPPNGYAVVTREIFFALRPKGSTVSACFYDAAGNEISAPKGVSGEYVTGNQLMTVTVNNLRGYALPATGGNGIFLYVLCGLILVSAPLVYGLKLRRKAERRSR